MLKHDDVITSTDAKEMPDFLTSNFDFETYRVHIHNYFIFYKTTCSIQTIKLSISFNFTMYKHCDSLYNIYISCYFSHFQLKLSTQRKHIADEDVTGANKAVLGQMCDVSQTL